MPETDCPTDHTEDLAAEAAQVLDHIRTLTARADRLLVRLRDNGMSWGDLAHLIDPDSPPPRSSAQRRLESARHRISMEATMTLIADLRQAAHTIADLLTAAVEHIEAGRPIHRLDPAPYRSAADTVEEVIARPTNHLRESLRDGLIADLRYAVTRGESLLRSTTEAAAMGMGIDLDLYRSTARDLTRLAERGTASSNPDEAFA